MANDEVDDLQEQVVAIREAIERLMARLVLLDPDLREVIGTDVLREIDSGIERSPGPVAPNRETQSEKR